METKSTVYVPSNIEIADVKWDQQEYNLFQTPFSNWLYYKMLINKNNTTKNIEIKFIIR
jgi:hypothetical protein